MCLSSEGLGRPADPFCLRQWQLWNGFSNYKILRQVSSLTCLRFTVLLLISERLKTQTNLPSVVPNAYPEPAILSVYSHFLINRVNSFHQTLLHKVSKNQTSVMPEAIFKPCCLWLWDALCKRKVFGSWSPSCTHKVWKMLSLTCGRRNIWKDWCHSPVCCVNMQLLGILA